MKVMILAYDFPPLPSAGAQRPFSWYQYLSEFGVYPVVITRQWEKNSTGLTGSIRPSENNETTVDIGDRGTLIRVPYNPNFRDKMILKFGENKFVFLRKMISFLLSIFKFYFRYFDNTDAIYRSADNYLRSNSCDLIIATGEPFVLFRHAYALSKKYRINYLLDYRDGWTSGLDLDLDSYRFKKLQKILFRQLEKKYIKHAEGITVASQTYIPGLKGIWPNNTYYEILNGYFEENFKDVKKDTSNQRMTIIYSGKLYKFQPLEEFIETLEGVLNGRKNSKVDVVFIGGTDDDNIIRRTKKYLNSSFVNIILLPRHNYDDYAKMLINADVLLLLSKDTGGWLNAKLFDYLPSLKKIVLFKSDNNIMSKIVKDCDAGIICDNRSQLMKNLDIIITEFLKNGFIASSNKNFELFSRRNQIKKLAEVFEKCVV